MRGGPTPGGQLVVPCPQWVELRDERPTRVVPSPRHPATVVGDLAADHQQPTSAAPRFRDGGEGARPGLVLARTTDDALRSRLAAAMRTHPPRPVAVLEEAGLRATYRWRGLGWCVVGLER